MTRSLFCIAFLATATVASAGIFSDSEPKASKGTTSEKVAYIEGTHKGLAPHTAGVLLFNDAKVMAFQHPKGTLTIPYSAISGAELGPLRGRDAGPAYRVWSAYRRLGEKSRYVTIHYTEKGATNRLVFELTDKAATLAVSQIEIAQGKRQGSVISTAANEELWWGDKYWRTNRNSEKWNKPSGAETPKSSAPDR